MLHRNMQVRSFFCVVKKDFRRVSHSAKYFITQFIEKQVCKEKSCDNPAISAFPLLCAGFFKVFL